LIGLNPKANYRFLASQPRKRQAKALLNQECLLCKEDLAFHGNNNGSSNNNSNNSNNSNNKCACYSYFSDYL
jgi:hypothetical protein